MKKITVSIKVNSDIAKVWEYWTNPKHIINWNFATDEWCCPTAENDLKPEGKFSWRMESKDGSIGFNFEGIYEKIIYGELIFYKMSDGREVLVKFEQNGNEVTIKETFDAEGTNSDEQQRAGWQAILGNFKKYIESQ